MNSIVSTSGHTFGITLPLHKGDYIPETLAYVFLMHLDSKKASEFQIKNYAKKNNKENVSVSDYIDENNLFPNAGKILNVAYYDNKLYLKINQRGEILSGLKYINYLFLIGGIIMNIATTTIIRSNPYAAIGGIAVLTLISLYKAGKFDDLIEEVSKKGIEFKDNFIKYYKDKGIIIGENEKGEPIFDKKKLTDEINMYITNIERAYMFYRKLKF